MADSQDRTSELADRLRAVRDRLEGAVAQAGRPPGSVDLMVVTKFFPAEDVARLISLGERTFGESREPEASRKVAALREADPDGPTAEASFDMIGGVQSKKAKTVARWARGVQSVDRRKVLDQLVRGAQESLDDGSRTQPLGIHLQVSLDGDPERGGVVESELPALAEIVAQQDAVRLDGVMVIAPLHGDTAHWMGEAARIAQALRANYPEARGLSAGMSGDLEVAVAHGATCVRVGTAILGSRPILSQ